MAPKLAMSSTWSGPSRAPQAGKGARDLSPHALPAFELDSMALAVVEADGLDAREGVERVGEADGRILPAREQHQRAGLVRSPTTSDYAPSTHIVLSLRPAWAKEGRPSLGLV